MSGSTGGMDMPRCTGRMGWDGMRAEKAGPSVSFDDERTLLFGGNSTIQILIDFGWQG